MTRSLRILALSVITTIVFADESVLLGDLMCGRTYFSNVTSDQCAAAPLAAECTFTK